MSNDINIPHQKPILTGSQNINKDGGGGGNLGYFQGNKKKQAQQESKETEEGDVFISSSKKEEEALCYEGDLYVRETDEQVPDTNYFSKIKNALNKLKFFKQEP